MCLKKKKPTLSTNIFVTFVLKVGTITIKFSKIGLKYEQPGIWASKDSDRIARFSSNGDNEVWSSLIQLENYPRSNLVEFFFKSSC